MTEAISMIAVAQLLLAAFAVSWVIADSKISYPARVWLGRKSSYRSYWLLALMECPACTGFHFGWIYGALTKVGWCQAMLDGLLVLTTNLVLEAIVSNIKESDNA